MSTAPARPDALSPDNAKTFWQGAWDHSQTGWKALEQNRAVFTKNIRGVEETLERHVTSSEEGNNKKSSVSIFNEHRGAFVPLCGDTFATRFLADGFVGCGVDSALVQVPEDSALFAACSESDENLHFVMGVDLAPDGILLNMKQNFPELAFTQVDHSGDAAAPSAGQFTHYFARAMNATNYGRIASGSEKVAPFVDIHLFVGDYFEVTAWWKAQAASSSSAAPASATTSIPYKPFDFSYDRASMVAMHPTLRAQYVQGVLGLFEGSVISPRVFLELARREEGKREAGPPFHIVPATVAVNGNPASCVDASEEVTVDPSAPTFYPIADNWVRLPLDYVDHEAVSPTFKFMKHVLYKKA